MGQKLNHETKKWDYVKEAMEAKGEKEADDMKHEKPLADAMVREGYLRPRSGSTMSERAVDHTEMPEVNMKEVAGLTGVQLQVSIS